MPVVGRYSGGLDIYAGCGMLAGRRPLQATLETPDLLEASPRISVTAQ